MRKEFIQALKEIAERDERVILMTADLGYTVLEEFAQSFPKRFFNVGVAEQNMVGMATSLAEAGFLPFLYSITNFVSLRPFEFIRNGPVMHRLPVRLVGVGSGFDYGPAGNTHYGLEDIGALRLLQGLTLVAPIDSMQAKEALQKTWNLPGPVYYRISKDSIPAIQPKASFELGKLINLSEGNDILFLSLGRMAVEALEACRLLKEKGISCSAAAVTSFNPSPDDDLSKILSCFKLAVTIEDHVTTGGLGSYVSEIAAASGLGCRVLRCGVDTPALDVSGSRTFMNQKYGLTAEKLATTAFNAWQNR